VRAHDLWRGKLPGGRDGHIIAARLDQPEEATFERFLADRAIEKLREYAADWKNSGQPFCLDVHFFGPHLPYFLPDELRDLLVHVLVHERAVEEAHRGLLGIHGDDRLRDRAHHGRGARAGHPG